MCIIYAFYWRRVDAFVMVRMVVLNINFELFTLQIKQMCRPQDLQTAANFISHHLPPCHLCQHDHCFHPSLLGNLARSNFALNWLRKSECFNLLILKSLSQLWFNWNKTPGQKMFQDILPHLHSCLKTHLGASF